MPTLKTPVSAQAVANTFLELAHKDNQQLVHPQLQMLVYFAHGWYLAYTDSPLIGSKILTAPVTIFIPEIYHALKGFNMRPLDKYIVSFLQEKKEVDIEKIRDKALRKFLKKVWDAYKKWDLPTLIMVGRKEGSPIAQLAKAAGGFEKLEPFTEIPTKMITDSFKEEVKHIQSSEQTLKAEKSALRKTKEIHHKQLEKGRKAAALQEEYSRAFFAYLESKKFTLATAEAWIKNWANKRDQINPHIPAFNTLQKGLKALGVPTSKNMMYSMSLMAIHVSHALEGKGYPKKHANRNSTTYGWHLFYTARQAQS
jgi:uncharacterized phage-associated protein